MPPEIKLTWEENDVWMQTLLVTFGQIRDYEEDEHRINMYKMLGAKSSLM